MSSIGPTASSEVGEILDADIYFNPSDSRTSHVTPLALTGTPSAYGMESILTHERGHSLGFSHSAVWNAMMFPLLPRWARLVALARRSDNPTLLWRRRAHWAASLIPGSVGHFARRRDSGAHIECESAITAAIAPWCYRRVWLAWGGSGCWKRRGCRGHRRRLELQRSGPCRIRRQLCNRAATDRKQLSGLCRAAEWRRGSVADQ